MVYRDSCVYVLLSEVLLWQHQQHLVMTPTLAQATVRLIRRTAPVLPACACACKDGFWVQDSLVER
jgi:hypothetical protein